MSNLKPCPFCGSYERHMCKVPTYYKPNPNVWYVKCDTCEAQGARHFTKAEAIAAWNSRAERTCHKVIPDEMKGYVFCSECGAEIGEYGYPNYCQNCGAKVVGE